MIELKEAKIIFNAGGLKEPKIINEILSNGWIILFEKKVNGKWVTDGYASRRSEDNKIFKDLRSAVNTIKNIGFNTVQIIDLQK